MAVLPTPYGLDDAVESLQSDVVAHKEAPPYRRLNVGEGEPELIDGQGGGQWARTDESLPIELLRDLGRGVPELLQMVPYGRKQRFRAAVGAVIVAKRAVQEGEFQPGSLGSQGLDRR
jgi:hypothetical protein